MARMNHSRPRLRLTDGFKKEQAQSLAAAKRMDAQNLASSVNEYGLKENQMRVVIGMLDAMNDYGDTFSQFAAGVTQEAKGSPKGQSKVKGAEETMAASIRAYLFLHQQETKKNGGKPPVGIKTIDKKLRGALKANLLVSAVFEQEEARMRQHTGANIPARP